MDPTFPLVALIVVIAAVWTIWTRLVPPPLRRQFAGFLQRSALKPGRSPLVRDVLLWSSQHVVGKCCVD